MAAAGAGRRRAWDRPEPRATWAPLAPLLGPVDVSAGSVRASAAGLARRAADPVAGRPDAAVPVEVVRAGTASPDWCAGSAAVTRAPGAAAASSTSSSSGARSAPRRCGAAAVGARGRPRGGRRGPGRRLISGRSVRSVVTGDPRPGRPDPSPTMDNGDSPAGWEPTAVARASDSAPTRCPTRTGSPTRRRRSTGVVGVVGRQGVVGAVVDRGRGPCRGPRGPDVGTSRRRTVVQAVLDHLEGQEVLPLLAQHPAQALHVVLVELAVARRRALRVDQALALEEPDLGDGDVGELLAEQGQHVPDRQVRAGAHAPAARAAMAVTRPPPPGRRSLNFPIWTSSPAGQHGFFDALPVHVGAVERPDVADRGTAGPWSRTRRGAGTR